MLKQRSQEKELIDLGSEYYTHDEYIQCLKKLFFINKFLGFFRSTVKILKKFSEHSTLLDVGCGGGLFVLNLNQHFPRMKMLGIDISQEAVDDAQKSLNTWQKNKPNLQVSFRGQDPDKLDMAKNSFDIILVTLVCHHLENDDLVVFLRQIHLAARKAVIINELHRHYLSHTLYKFISPLFFKNRLIIHDGLISIRRGFIRSEWQLLLQKAGIENYQLKWGFPFRWQLILRKESVRPVSLTL